MNSSTHTGAMELGQKPVADGKDNGTQLMQTNETTEAAGEGCKPSAPAPTFVGDEWSTVADVDEIIAGWYFAHV